jgi:hypothetical protein
MTAQIPEPINIHQAKMKMKNASDAQEYRIQRKLLEINNDSEQIMFMECYDMHSTGLQN